MKKKMFSTLPFRVIKGLWALFAIFVIGVGALSYSKFNKYKTKSRLQNQMAQSKEIPIDGELFCDIQRFLELRAIYKKHRPLSSSTYHTRLANKVLNFAPLSNAFGAKLDHVPKWMQDQVEAEFALYRRFSVSDVRGMLKRLQDEEGYVNRYLIAKYKIYDGTVYVQDYSGKHPRLTDFALALCRLAKTVKLPNIEFLLSFHDSLDFRQTAVPVLVFSKMKDNPFMIMVPDHEMMSGYDTCDGEIDRGSAQFPWGVKIEKAFWRGGTSSGDFSLPSWREFPRSRLVFQSLSNPESVDARFSQLVQGAKNNPDFLQNQQLIGNFVLPADSLKYKYQVEADGNASTYSHFYWVLRSNSVPIKQNSPYTMWYHGALEPYTHFIPIREDFSDLPEKVKWARTHDSEAREIAKASEAFAKEYLTTEYAYLYLYLVLKKYGEIQSSH